MPGRTPSVCGRDWPRCAWITVCRIIHRRFAATPLGCVPAPSRFSDPDGLYAVLYAALTVRCAVWEALLRDDYLDARRDELPVEEEAFRTIELDRSPEARDAFADAGIALVARRDPP